MAASKVQLWINAEKIRLMWDPNPATTYRTYNLYYSTNADMSGEATVATNIPNVAGSIYSNRHVMYEFTRASIGIGLNEEFYVRLKGVNPAGVEDAANPGPTKLIPALNAQREEYDATQVYGFDSEKGLWKKLSVGDNGSLLGNKSTLTLFDSKVLTGTYTSSSTVSTTGFGQAILYIGYTKGVEATMELTFQFSPDGSTWFDDVYETVAAPTTTTVKEYQFTGDTTERLAISITDIYMRVRVKGSPAGPAPTGTVTAYLILGWQ